MKKLSLLLKPLLVAAVMVALASCEKEQTNTELVQGEATLARIMDFKQQVDYYKANPAVKDGETVTLDEAIWNIEALFNLTYAYPELSYGHTVTADTMLYLPVGANNTVLLTDLTVFYGQMYDVVRDIYQSIDLDNKQFLILDVEAGELLGGQQTIKLHSVQGSVKGAQPEPEVPQMWEPFEDGPDWYYGEDRGRRDGSFYLEMDAADTLANMLNANLVHTAPNGFTYIYTQTMMKELGLGVHDVYSNNSYPGIGPYSEYYVENPSEDDKWLDADHMNYYYFGESHLVKDVLPCYGDTHVPSSHYFFNVTIIDNKTIEDATTIVWHHTQAFYGHRDVVGDNTIIKGNL